MQVMVALSLNEIEQLCLKAARGAGFEWGLAEEAGFAAGWLAQRGMDGPRVMLSRLALPPVAPPAWPLRQTDGPACPIALGVTLMDYATLPATDVQIAPLMTGPVALPVLILPFIAVMARKKAQPLTVQFGTDQSIGFDASGEMRGGVAQIATVAQAALTITAQPSQWHLVNAEQRCDIAAETIAALAQFAMRTTVPASAVSRAGAGAAESDSD